MGPAVKPTPVLALDSLRIFSTNVKKFFNYENVEIEVKTETVDNRSYHVSSKKIKEILNFETKYTIQNAVLDLKNAFEKKLLTNTFKNELFFNIKRMNSLKLQWKLDIPIYPNNLAIVLNYGQT